MFLQIDMIDSHINDRRDGSVEIHGQGGYIVVNAKAEYAKKIKDAYQKLLKAYPAKDSLKITVNIEVPQPAGELVNEG
jgi:hypothetical protein